MEQLSNQVEEWEEEQQELEQEVICRHCHETVQLGDLFDHAITMHPNLRIYLSRIDHEAEEKERALWEW